jgi:hypothetical protein
MWEYICQDNNLSRGSMLDVYGVSPTVGIVP